jgi:hypothetical protein
MDPTSREPAYAWDAWYLLWPHRQKRYNRTANDNR